MYTIRHYTEQDFPLIKSWWEACNENPPTEELLPLGSTLILEFKDLPALCASLLLTNCKGISYIENFIGNPSLKGKQRQEASKTFMDLISNFAFDCGYSRIVGYTYSDKLKDYYKSLGFNNMRSGAHLMVREV